MDVRHEWPAGIDAVVSERFGGCVGVERLGGMSGSVVLRLHVASGTLILKRSVSPVETHVYTRLAETFGRHGVVVPDLYAHETASGEDWLLIEDVAPLPPDRWGGDDVLSMLGRLHGIDPRDVSLPEGRYVPGWPDAMTERALLLIAPDHEGMLLLRQFEARASPLFEPLRLISGDANPANWGIRADGTPVLFDWERFTLGAPAIDVAIALPGLPLPTVIGDAATRYLQLAGPATVSVTTFATDVAIAKVWSVVEFVATCATGEVSHSFPLEPLLDHLPGWLCTIHGSLKKSL